MLPFKSKCFSVLATVANIVLEDSYFNIVVEVIILRMWSLI